MNISNKKVNRSMIDKNLARTNSNLTVNTKSNNIKDEVHIKIQEMNPSPGNILLPSTIGIPPRNGSPESRLRDPRILWAPAISISGKIDQPLITPQYQKKQQRIIEKSEQVKLNPKIATNNDLSHLTRLGPGPTSYQRYKDYEQMGEEYIYTQQPRIRIHPLIGPKLKRERYHHDINDQILSEEKKKKDFQNIKPFWTTIGTRTYDSRLPNAPISTIHHRFDMTYTENKTNKLRGITMPGPAMYPIINTNNETIKRDICGGVRGVTIAPRYREKHLELSGPGPAMIERELLDKGYKNILRKSPAFTMSFLDSNTCNDRIQLNRQQNKSSIYCSSCSTYINGKISASSLQIELPSLTQITGISVRHSNQDKNSTIGSYFIEYRRTQDGPWHSYGRRRQRKLVIERRRLFFNDDDNLNKTRTFLPSIIARQIRIIFGTSSISICTIIQEKFYLDGLISTRLPQRSIINTDLKYDGLIVNSTARGGLGMLTDGDTHHFIHWSPSSEPILLLFGFDTIKEFQSINLDIKCSLLLLSSCTLKINVGILEIVTSNNLWTNHFNTISIQNHLYYDNTTQTHLILSVPKTKGQFVIIQINTKEGLALSEITFNNQNEYDNDQYIIPSSIYIEANLRRLELLAYNAVSNEIILHHRLSYLLIFMLIICVILLIVIPEETEQSLTISITNSTNDENIQNHSQLDLYSNLENDDELISNSLQLINSQKIVNESAKATIRILSSRRRSITPKCSVSNLHSVCDHLSEIDRNEILIIQNLGVQNNQQCFYSEYGQNKLSVILYEQDNNEFFNLSKLIDHKNIVSCLGYVYISPERCLLVSEYSQVNLFEYCQTMTIENENTATILMEFLNDILSALIHLESLNLIVRDLTLPNCLVFNDKTIKLSDYAKQDDRYVSRYVQQMPIRWLPGDIVTEDEIWSVETNTFMFGTLVFELFHLGSCVPYSDLNNDEVLQLFHDLWPNSKQNSIEPSVLCFSTYFPRPTLCNDRLYAFIERCLSWSISNYGRKFSTLTSAVEKPLSNNRCAQLKQMLLSPQLEFIMEAHSALSAKIVEETGFKAIWASGLSMSASLGLRDSNEASWTQVLDILEFMADATRIPILVDADTGFGNFNNARRLVRKLEQLGIAGACIEDKLFPKTNSLLEDRQQPLADMNEFALKIRAMKDTQQDPKFCVVARVEAFISGWGCDEAIRRAEAYLAAGADAILMHSKQKDPKEIEQFMKVWNNQGPVIIVPTNYYQTPTETFQKWGISAIIWANHNLRASIKAMQATSKRIYNEQTLVNVESNIVSVKEVFRLQNDQELVNAEKKYLPIKSKN
ncbi:unnamed protein product [Rotaria sp. Silwood1]|nr:unnamed protein product [Rotaria sp. Silwood1]